MKYLGLLLSSLLFTGVVYSQKPEKVYSIVKEMRTADWYQEQSKLWKAVVDNDNKNAEAWYNYYSANRALKNISWGDTAAVNKHQKVCNQIAESAYKAIPNTFEGNHIVWWNGYSDKSKIDYLKKAYEIDPTDSRAYRDMMIHYMLEFDEAGAKVFAEKIYKVNEMPASAYSWAYNLLAEAEPNAIIFTAGDNDTYLPWIVQQVHGFRQDVTIMNTSLIFVKDYNEKLLNDVGIKAFEGFTESFNSHEQYLVMQKQLFNHIFKQDLDHPVYVSATALHQFKDNFEDQLFLTGLLYKYCDKSIDNIAYIKRNYEKRYLLDYLKYNFAFNQLDKKTNDFNVYYLQSFIKLHKHYIDSEEIAKAELLKERIIAIAENGGKMDALKDWINEYK